MLAILFVLECFLTYTYGKITIVETDHKPLITIVWKPLSDVPKRLQRISTRFQKYDYELVYLPEVKWLFQTLYLGQVRRMTKGVPQFEHVPVSD